MEGEALEANVSPQEDNDMMALTIVALNDDVPPKSDGGLRLLYTLISSTISGYYFATLPHANFVTSCLAAYLEEAIQINSISKF